MTLKRMQHPEHGFQDVLTNAEADVMRKAGWTDYVVPAKLAPKVEEPKVEEPKPVVEPTFHRGPGRPPKG
jgi:hypothetical protein